MSLIDHEDIVISGSGFDTAIAIKENAVRQKIRWQGEPPMESLKGHDVRLAFRLRGDVTLYEFVFTG